MDEAVFRARLVTRSQAARDFARRCIKETLPEPLLFRIRLNSSFDGNPLAEGEHLFPEDSQFDRAAAVHCCDAAEVVRTLWRDGRVPEWINLSVVGETGSATIVEVLCCGRFTARDALLYHVQEGSPPFHVLGPTLPPGHGDSDKPFSIYHRAECWDAADVERVVKHAKNVWSLELVGQQSDDDALRRLPALPNLELLTLRACPTDGSGLRSIAAQPRLRILRVSLQGNRDVFRFPRVRGFRRGFRRLEAFHLTGLPEGEVPLSGLVESVPGLQELTLGTRGNLRLTDALHPSLKSLEFVCQGLHGAANLPRRVESLSLRLSRASDAEVCGVLEHLQVIRRLSLRGTLVTDALVDLILARGDLETIDVVDTKISEAGVRRIMAERPTLGIMPDLRNHET
jgi:hypothetical protein